MPHKTILLACLLLVLAITGTTGYFMYMQTQPASTNTNTSINDTYVAPKQILLETTPPEISLMYPETLIGCVWGNTIQIRGDTACDKNSGPRNFLGISDETDAIKKGYVDHYTLLNTLAINETKDGITEGEKMAGVTYKRLADTSVGGYITKNYELNSNRKDSRETRLYSYIFGPDEKIYFLSQSYEGYPNEKNIYYGMEFNKILKTVQFTKDAN